MSWLRKFEKSEDQERAIIYIPPELLSQVFVMPVDEFEAFQNSQEFVPGGQLMEVCRQYGYSLRQVADLHEETITFRKAEPTPAMATSASDSASPDVDTLMADQLELVG